MTIQEYYKKIGGSYEDVKSRLMKDDIIKRFVIKFLSDESYNNLVAAMADKDYEVAFRSAHTLKGICNNLGFATLGESASDLTEALRGWENAPIDVSSCELKLQKLESDYKCTVASINDIE